MPATQNDYKERSGPTRAQIWRDSVRRATDLLDESADALAGCDSSNPDYKKLVDDFSSALIDLMRVIEEGRDQPLMAAALKAAAINSQRLRALEKGLIHSLGPR